MGCLLNKMRDINGAILRKKNIGDKKLLNLLEKRKIEEWAVTLLNKGKSLLKEYNRVVNKIDLYGAQITLDTENWGKDVNKFFEYVGKKVKNLGYIALRDYPEKLNGIEELGDIETKLFEDSYMEFPADKHITNTPIKPGEFGDI